ncbi:MAG: CHAD domain-containing protein [Actinomycetota bacterium]
MDGDQGPERSPPLGEADRSQPAGRVFAILLESLLAEASAHEAGVLAEEDPEELHDYRVAIRRTRSLLRVTRGVLPERERLRLRHELRWLGDLTSPVRDLDVLAGDLDGLVAEVQPELHGGVQSLNEALTRERTVVAARLEDGLGSQRYAELVRLWHLTARVYLIGGEAPPAARRSAGTVADEAIVSSERRLRRIGRNARHSDDLEDWHDLRKALKQFRYVIGTLAPLYPPEAFSSVRRILPKIQDVLGRLQDHHVQAELIGRLGVSAGGETALLAGAIADRLHRDVERVHRKCASTWRDLERSELGEQLRTEMPTSR